VAAGARIVRALATVHGEVALINADADHTTEWKHREVAKRTSAALRQFAPVT